MSNTLTAEPAGAGGDGPRAPAGGGAASVWSLFRRQAAAGPGRAAVIGSAGRQGGRWTYGEFEWVADNIGRGLVGRLGGAGEPVAILAAHDAWAVAAVMGVLAAGKLYVVLDPSHPPLRLQKLVAACGARAVLADASHAAQAAELFPDAVVLAVEALAAGGGAGGAALPEVTADTPACIAFTSGSTGEPKGVVIDHGGLAARGESFAALGRPGPEDRVALVMPAGLGAAPSSIYGALLHGACLLPFCVASQGAERLARWVREERVTMMQAAPTVLRRLAEAAGKEAGGGGGRLESLRFVRMAGEAVTPGDGALFRSRFGREAGKGAGGCRLAVAYATTETGTIAQRLLADGEEVTWPPAVGREVEGVTVADAGGELVVTGRWLHRGYWPAVAPPGEREYRTGDLGRRREDGMLEWQGRRDEQVKLRGQRIELGEIEAALRSLENVREAVAGVVDGPAGTRRLAAWVVPANHRRVSVGAWREALRQKLPAGLVPEAFVVLGALPVGGGGKVDRRALPAPAAGPARGAGEGRPADPPQGELEQTLAGIWERVLGVAPVGRADDFFDLGGDSLLAAAIVARIEEAVGSLPPLALFLQASTVAAQAAALQKGWADIRSTVVPLAGADGGGGPVIYCVHSGEGEVFRYRALARRLAAEWGGVVYGLQSPAMRGEWPPWTFAGFARRHADDILAQARGGGAPCFIVGHCVGGILAVEIARALERAGRAVHGVVLINTPVPGKTARLRTSHWRKRWTDAVAHRVRVVRWRVRLAVDALRGAGGGGGMRGGGQRFGSAFRRFGDRAYMDALRRHRLSAYHGRVLALLAEATWDAGEDPRLAFVRACAPAACVGHVPGNHTSCLQGPHVEAVAAAMRAFLAGG